ncbi:MAG: hypothetical protein SGILL_002935, partial [Bacillariaceae sp.]
ANILTEDKGRSKGCGLVTYQHPKDAQRAIRELNESTLGDRKIFVSKDKRDGGGGGGGVGGDRRDGGGRDDRRSTRSGGSGSGGGGGSEPSSLFVGNLSYETSWQELKDWVRDHSGKASAAVERVEVMEFPDGKSKGHGIVKFSTSYDASRAIDRLDGVELRGRRLDVHWDRDASSYRDSSFRGGEQRQQPPPPPRRDGGGHRREKAGEDGSGGSQLYVGNIPFETKWYELKDLFKQSGRVDKADVIEGVDGRKKGFGIVRFFNEDDAQNAINLLNDTDFNGRRIDVRWDRRDGGGGGGGGRRPPSDKRNHGGGRQARNETNEREDDAKPRSNEMEYDHEKALGGALSSSR